MKCKHIYWWHHNITQVRVLKAEGIYVKCKHIYWWHHNITQVRVLKAEGIYVKCKLMNLLISYSWIKSKLEELRGHKVLPVILHNFDLLLQSKSRWSIVLFWNINENWTKELDYSEKLKTDSFFKTNDFKWFTIIRVF